MKKFNLELQILRNKIATKIVLAFVITVASASVTLGIFRIYESYHDSVDNRLIYQKNQIELIGLSMQSRIEELKNDTLFLSATPPIQGIQRALHNNGVDPVDGSSTAVWIERLETIFKEMIHAKKNYLQIRYIGVKDQGRELVRVERIGSKVIRVPQKKLQQKGHRPYFKQTIKLQRNEIFLSDFDLNQEFGKIEIPIQMVVRSAVPIYDENGNSIGIIIINMSYNQIFSTMRVFVAKYSDYFVADHKNQILLHSNPDFNFDTQIESIKKIGDYLTSYQEVDHKGKISVLKTNGDNAKIIVRYDLYYNINNNEQFLSIFLATAKVNFLNNIFRNLLVESIIIMSLIIVSILVAILVARKITYPLQRLAQIVPFLDDPIASKKLKEISHSDDEIGILAENIYQLSSSLLEKNQTLKAQKEALDCTALVLETDQNGNIIYANDQARSISGYSQEELRELSLISLADETSKQKAKHLLEEGDKEDHISKKELCFLSKEGSKFWVQATIYPVLLKDGMKKFVTIQFDISSRVLAEKDLRIAKEKAEKIAKFKSDFLANMSHEIRTPISGIIGLNDFLCDSELNETQKKWVQSIRESAATLLVIINDILDLSKFESGKVELESSTVNLKDLVKAIFDMLKGKADAKNIMLQHSFSSEIPHFIKTDPARLRQVLTNILSNAIKFTEHGEVSLSVSAKTNDDNKYIIKFAIRDTGIGIPPERIQAVFEPFTQADPSTTRKFGGTGLGLTITKRFVELMGGTIHVESTVGKGSIFYFTIKADPYDESKANNKKIAAIIPNDKTIKLDKNFARHYPCKILVAEDNEVNQEIIRIIFSKLGYDFDLVSSGEEALKFAEQTKYDVIFMDIRMPGMMGTEVCKIIKSTSDFASHGAWIIAATANVFKEDRENYYNIGFDDFLPKPYSKKLLAHMLTNSKDQNSNLKQEFMEDPSTDTSLSTNQQTKAKDPKSA